MNVKLTKANTFEIEPGKQYLAIINIDEPAWTDQQKDQVRNTLNRINVSTVFLPRGSKYKIVAKEDTDERTISKTPKTRKQAAPKKPAKH